MLPVGQLMIEHRLIERVIKLWKAELERIEKNKCADPSFIDKAVDFMKIYADRCHHGKEEDILFRDMKKKPISGEISRILQELMDEHVISRKNLAGLVDARKKYEAGDKAALKDIHKAIKTITELYPQHIEKEDKRFFLPSMNYFSDDEKARMITEFNDFDRNLIHQRYKSIVAQIEQG